MDFPAEYMFKDVPNRLELGDDPINITLGAMDKHGIAVGLVGLGNEVTISAIERHPDRFKPTLEVDPNNIGVAVRSIRRAYDEFQIKAVTTFPAGCNPQVPLSDRRYYPIYQTCVDLDIPMVANAGIAGPRVPSECQNVMHFDQVCYDFPDLRLVMRHGAEPWEDLAVKLMLKWPGLYYMTSAFAPKYYPKAVVDYANTRGADKIMYAGYYPMGLSLDRIFSELPDVPFRDRVWPLFVRENAVRVFKLEVTT
jgi:predicted TIM-barrel fold metal-dependent hydrolase